MIRIRAAAAGDIGLIHELILALADYEKLLHEVRADPAMLARHLFGARPAAEVLIAEKDGAAMGFALFFHTFSTFEGRPGLYLEDLYVRPEARGLGAGAGTAEQAGKGREGGTEGGAGRATAGAAAAGGRARGGEAG